MLDIQISSLEANTKGLDEVRAGEIVQAGFGGRSLSECITDARDHLENAKLLQTARVGKTIVGFAMYEQFSEGADLYLNGIVIDRSAQAIGLGCAMVTKAVFTTSTERLFAVTRNPAIFRLMESVCVSITPTLTGKDLELSQRQLITLSSLINLPTEDLPYHRGRYPLDLYDRTPTHHDSKLQSEFERRFDLSDATDAILVVGDTNHEK